MSKGIENYVWYVGYGSNLLRERFNYYILGGQFRLGGSSTKGCADKTLPVEDKTTIIPYGLYFAKESSSWKNGGVAFISTKKDETRKTHGRMWKITEGQFSEIWKQEGKERYNEKIELGNDQDGIPIWTITNNSELPINKPSDNYLKTIALGLKESFGMEDKAVINYLVEIAGVKNKFNKEELAEIINSADKF